VSVEVSLETDDASMRGGSYSRTVVSLMDRYRRTRDSVSGQQGVGLTREQTVALQILVQRGFKSIQFSLEGRLVRRIRRTRDGCAVVGHRLEFLAVEVVDPLGEVLQLEMFDKEGVCLELLGRFQFPQALLDVVGKP